MQFVAAARRTRHLWRAGAAMALTVTVALWLRPHALSIYHVESGGRALEVALEPVFSYRLAPEQIVHGEQLQTGLTHLQAALRWDPRNTQALRLLARVYLSQNQPEAALEVLQRALEISPANPLLHLELGDAYDSVGQAQEAIQFYETGGIGSRSAPLAANYLKLADAQILWGSGELAIGLWRNALELDSGNLYALYRLMEIHWDLEDEEHAAQYEEQLRYFDLQSTAVPPDFRLAEHQGWTMAALVDKGIWERDTLLNVVSYQVRQSTEGVPGLMAERVLQALLEQRPEDPDLLFYLAELYRLQGDLEQAEVAYRYMLAVDLQYPEAYPRLGMLAQTSCESQEANCPELGEVAEWYGQYYDMAPDDLLGLKRLAEVCATLEQGGMEDGSCRDAAGRVVRERGGTAPEELGSGESHNSPAEVLWLGWLEQASSAEPDHFVGQESDHGWTLLGYDVDEDRLIRGEPVDMLLYWVGPASASAGSEQNGWYRAGERWVQVLEGVQNLIPNGGFELGLEDGSPTGFPLDFYHADSSTRRLATDSRGGRRSIVAMLDNTEVYSRTSYASTHVPINPHGLYLLAGWIKSIGGSGYLGPRWMEDASELAHPYTFVASGVSLDDWQHYAGMTQPLQAATRCHAWLLNYMTVGRVYFDNILFIEIGMPGQ